MDWAGVVKTETGCWDILDTKINKTGWWTGVIFTKMRNGKGSPDLRVGGDHKFIKYVSSALGAHRRDAKLDPCY